MAPLRWRSAASTLAWRHWPDAPDWVVFNPASGDLHLLNEPAAAVLQAIERQPSTAQELASCLAGDGSRPAPDEPTIARLLESLDALGLVEPVPPVP